MKHLSVDDVKRLQEQLVALRAQLLNEIRTAEADIKAAQAALGGEVRSGSDASELTRLQEIRRSEIELDESKLDAVSEAERRISEGLYGVCIACGEPIAPGRLFALPTSVRCIACENLLSST